MLTLALTLLQEHAAEAAQPGLMDIRLNVMFWLLIIFGILFLILYKKVYPVILGAVETREKALAAAIEAAKKDRDEAARLLEEHKANIASARDEAQKLIAEARGISEKSKADMLERTRQEQQEMLERARRDIANERDKAIAELRREAVDLAIAGASKVVEQNLDSDKNRKLVEAFLSSLSESQGKGR